MIDIPGHAKLRGSFKTYIKGSKKLVIVIDSTTVERNASELSNFILSIFQCIIKEKNRTSILFACNKSDELLALSREKIKIILADEM